MSDQSIASNSPNHVPYRLLREWFAGGIANAITSGILNPMDVVKTRLQTRVHQNSENHRLMATFVQLYQEGGVIGLWSPGLMASAFREMLNSGARAGFYTTVRDHINQLFGDDNHRQTLLPKIFSAMITGTLGAIIANPIDVIKIRLMANPHLYPSTIAAFPIIIQREGVFGLYKGLIPSTLRGAFIAAGELASYDHSKTTLKTVFGFREGTTLHVCSSLITGLVATTVAAPFDIIKTRAMNSTSSSGFEFFNIFLEIVTKEGPQTLMRGWIPSYLRLGPHALICFPIFEKIRQFIGLDYF